MGIVLVIEVDAEPFEWGFLNDINVFADVTTVCLILFDQLDMDWAVDLTAYLIFIGVVTPVVVKLLFPKLPEGTMFDEDGHVVDIPAHPRSYVELAAFEEAMGVNGMRLFKRVQR